MTSVVSMLIIEGIYYFSASAFKALSGDANELQRILITCMLFVVKIDLMKYFFCIDDIKLYFREIIIITYFIWEKKF